MHQSDEYGPEATLIGAARRGDADGWRVLIQRTYPAVASFVRWRCGGRSHWHDDILQDAWLSAATLLHQYDERRGDFAAWVCGLAANCVRRVWRRDKAEARHRVPMLTEPESFQHDTAHDPELVALALNAIPAAYEAVLRWKYYDGCTVAEMAVRAGKSAKAVESELTRARAAFRQKYEGAGS